MRKGVYITRREPQAMGELVRQYIRSMQLSAGLDTHRIFAAWDAVSGAGPFTLGRYFRSGTLYITVSSSVIRSQLYFQREILLEKLNAYLAGDDLFTGSGSVKNLVLK